ncbi:MAG: hypothetical protein ACK4PC_03495 [Sphingopyxis sp.]
MAWESISNKKPVNTAAEVPAAGVRLAPRKMGWARGGKSGETRYIKLSIGAELAKKLGLITETVRLRLLFGRDSDAGKIAISVDAETGNFLAKRDKAGRYTLTINQATAEGLFALDFPAFNVALVEAVRPENGQPRRAAFKVSPAMLAVADI